jgi:hypothetical protein
MAGATTLCSRSMSANTHSSRAATLKSPLKRVCRPYRKESRLQNTVLWLWWFTLSTHSESCHPHQCLTLHTEESPSCFSLIQQGEEDESGLARAPVPGPAARCRSLTSAGAVAWSYRGDLWVWTLGPSHTQSATRTAGSPFPWLCQSSAPQEPATQTMSSLSTSFLFWNFWVSVLFYVTTHNKS